MTDYITKIRTIDGDKQIDYNALANLPDLDQKANIIYVDTAINNHITDINNPHKVTKEQLGIENVDNTSDVEKPISHATQEALDTKADSEHGHNDLYYTKLEIDDLELITREDIRTICSDSIQYAEEVSF